MSYLVSVFFAFLNIYVAYKAVQQFNSGEMWPLLNAIVVLSIWIVTIPVFILSVFQIKRVRQNKRHQHIVAVIFGLLIILGGFVSLNVNNLWFLIVFFGLLEIIATIICKSDRSSKDNVSKETSVTTSGNKVLVKGSSYRMTLIFQIIGLILLFILSVSFWVPSSSDVEFTPNQHIIYASVFTFIFLLHVLVTIAFTKKKGWALRYRYIETYILLILSILLFLSAVISEGVSMTNTFFAILLGFLLFILLFIYLIFSYKKLKKSGLF